MKNNKHSSKISSKGQVTVPSDIRGHLNAEAGDLLGFFVEDEKVILKKLEALDLEYYQALDSTVSQEWNSKEDDEAYADL